LVSRRRNSSRILPTRHSNITSTPNAPMTKTNLHPSQVETTIITSRQNMKARRGERNGTCPPTRRSCRRTPRIWHRRQTTRTLHMMKREISVEIKGASWFLLMYIHDFRRLHTLNPFLKASSLLIYCTWRAPNLSSIVMESKEILHIDIVVSCHEDFFVHEDSESTMPC
jgi:hypothetical protein